MPFIQKGNPPEDRRININVDDMSGGLNNVMSTLNLKDNESPNLLNVMCHTPGIVESRPGLFKYVLSQLPEVIYKIFRYQTDTVDCLLCSGKTKLFRINIGEDTYTEVCTVNDTISGVQKLSSFYFVDGVKYREYDGTNVYEIIAPSIESHKITAGSGTTITLPTTASAVDDFYNNWSVYIVSGLGYGEKAIITDYVGSTKVATIDFTTLPDATSVVYMTNKPHGVLTTDEVGKTKCYTPTSLEFSDAFQGDNNIGMANDCKLIELHHERIWFTLGTNQKTVFSTDLDNMYYVPTNAYYPALTNDGDKVIGLRSFNDALVIIKKNTFFALYGWDRTDFQLTQVNSTTGAFNNEVVQIVNNYLFFLGSDGHVHSMYDLRTDVKKMMTKNISGQKIDIRREPININLGEVNNAISIYSNDFYMLAIGDKVLAYNTLTGQWVLWNHINPTVFFDLDNELLMSNVNRYVYRMPLRRFYIEETFIAASTGDNICTVRKGLINEISTDVDIYVNTIQVGVIRLEKRNLTDFVVYGCTIGDVIKVVYLSLPTYLDDAEGYSQYVHTKDFHYNAPSKMKKIRVLNVLAHTFKYFTSNIRFDVWIDHQEFNSNIVISNKITLWGLAKFGDRFINRNVAESQPIIINNRGKIIRYVITSDGAGQPFKFYNITGEIHIRA